MLSSSIIYYLSSLFIISLWFEIIAELSMKFLFYSMIIEFSKEFWGTFDEEIISYYY